MSDRKYKAFISYSHADEASASWLQRSLERFRAPSSLSSALKAKGKSARLSPVFRDREDLPVGGSLNSAIKTALADSEFQIVLCSPNSAKSRWVNEEIKLFHKLNGPGRVFAFIISGEPNASLIAGRESEECFPPALRFALDADGNVTEAPAETLAADARESGDGKRYAVLKVAAGMLGVGLDDLVRREASRRARQAWTVTSASLIGTAAAAALAYYAIEKGREATKMRGEAENLIDFMLTDLRDRLEKVGRLDVLESVGDRAMNYYSGQNLASLSDDALAQRAKTLLLLGSIDFRRNDLDSAERAYLAAETTTGELLRRSPKNAGRIFEHAQAVFYVSDVARAKRDMETAERMLMEYLRLAEMLLEIDPNDPKWRLEYAYATNNLGILKFNEASYDEAIALFAKSIEERRILSEAARNDEKVAFAYAYALSWQAYAELLRGTYGNAVALIERQLLVYGDAAGPQSENYQALDTAVTAQRRLAEAYIGLGELSQANNAVAAASATADRLLARDSANANWIVNAAFIDIVISYLAANAGDQEAAIAAADSALDRARSVVGGDGGGSRYREALARALIQRVAAGGGEAEAMAADELFDICTRMYSGEIMPDMSIIASASLVLSSHARKRGDFDRSRATVDAAIRALEPLNGKIDIKAKIALAGLYLEKLDLEKAAAIIAEIDKIGVKSPEFLAHRRRLIALSSN